MPSVIVMQLRYAFRLYPDAAQQAALARALGCARVVFNDAVGAREDARKHMRHYRKRSSSASSPVARASGPPGSARAGAVVRSVDSSWKGMR